jgi:hypothetical protein
VLKALADPPHGLEDVRETLLGDQSRRAPVDEKRAGTAA